MKSNQIDSYLILRDDNGAILREHDDIQQGVVLDAQIVYTPNRAGFYRIEATHFRPPPGQFGLPTIGNYSLTIQRQ
jgi:hypothetical protein